MRRALQLAPIREVAADIRQTLTKAEAQLPSRVPLADHLADVGRVVPLSGARNIRVAAGYDAICRYDRTIESVAERRRQTSAQIRLNTYLETGRVVMRIQAALSREATGGRSPVELSLAASFENNGKLDQVRVTSIVAAGINDRQKRRAAVALSDRMAEVLRLRYAGGTYRQDGRFTANAALLRRAYQRQFRVYDKGAQITDFDDRSRLVGTTRRGSNEYYVIDTRLRGASFVAGAEILLEAKGYLLIDARSGLIAEQRERMVTKIVDRGLRVVESESQFECDIRSVQKQVAKAVASRDRPNPQRIAVVDAELIPINQIYRAKSNVNIRRAPRVNSARIGGLQRGEQVTAIGRVRGYDWILVGRNGNQLGYIFYSLIEPDPATVAAQPVPPPPSTTLTNQRRPAPRHETNPQGIAVIIGNRAYGGDIPPVDFAHNDADAMRSFVIDTLGYRDGNIIDLRDATKAQIERVFGNDRDHKGQLFDWVRPDRSDVVVFYSGHGVPGIESNRGYLLPVDGDPNRAELVGFGLDVMVANLKRLPARSITVYLDTCFSGTSHGGSLMRAASGLTITPKLPDQPDKLTILTAAQANQIASWDNEAGHGLFTRHLLAALNGAADQDGYGDGDGRVTLGEVKRFLDEEMTYQARRRLGRDQLANVVGGDSVVLATVR